VTTLKCLGTTLIK